MSEKQLFTPPYPLNTAVLFLVFNRPDTTRQVFDAIRKAKPPRLYLAADGPREGKAGEARRVEEVREYVTQNVDWDCEVKTLFREENLGCKYAVSSAITWFFDNEEQGIVLEDDCLPSQSFFWFCEEILEKYKNDLRVWHVGGTNPIDEKASSSSYYFSNYNRIWGWATWRRAWSHYNAEIPDWPDLKRRNILDDLLGGKEGNKYKKIFDDVYTGKIDTWDYQWFLIRLLHGAAIIPKVNLISNIGFGAEATHTLDVESRLSRLSRGEILFPLEHPRYFIVDANRDRKWREFTSSESSLVNRILKKLGVPR